MVLLLLLACDAEPIHPVVCDAATSPATIEEVAALRAEGVTWEGHEARAVYLCRVATIGRDDARRAAEALPAEERARAAYTARREARVLSRAMMSPPGRTMLEARDLWRYGHAEGPTFEELLAKAEAEGLDGDARYEAIIASAQSTNESVNRAAGVEVR